MYQHYGIVLKKQTVFTMLLVIDNYDSFTYNLVHYFETLGQAVTVARNDEILIRDIAALNPTHIVLSPGPGRPEDAGITLDCIHAFAGKISMLGVCLGHQAIGYYFGASITHAKKILHGKTSAILHNHQGVFKNCPKPFTATRYHSLVIDQSTLPNEIEVTAWTTNANQQMEEVMGIRHKRLSIEGVQFHPESILTENGYTLLNNFLQQYTAPL